MASYSETTMAAGDALIIAAISGNIPLESLLSNQSSEIQEFARFQNSDFLRWRRARDVTVPPSTLIPPMPPCPHPELIGKVVCKKFTVYETTKDFYGRVKWDEENGKFYVRYEDDDWENLSVNEIRRYIVTMSHFFEKIDETGNRAMKFSRFLKFLSKNSRRRVRAAFRDLGLKGHRAWATPIGPYLWPLLGHDENEKVAVSKKVLEYVYCN